VSARKTTLGFLIAPGTILSLAAGLGTSLVAHFLLEGVNLVSLLMIGSFVVCFIHFFGPIWIRGWPQIRIVRGKSFHEEVWGNIERKVEVTQRKIRTQEEASVDEAVSLLKENQASWSEKAPKDRKR
jgi:hypothetical protein